MQGCPPGLVVGNPPALPTATGWVAHNCEAPGGQPVFAPPTRRSSATEVLTTNTVTQIEQTSTLLENIGVKPTTAVVDMGYRGVDEDLPAVLAVVSQRTNLAVRPRFDGWAR